MKPLITKGIVLARTDFGEADRILTMLTPDHGKLRLMAKGVRKVRSKLAGGIELFSVSDISVITGKGEIDTLISARLQKHFGQIVNDIARVQLGYDLIKQINRLTADNPESDYFKLLEQSFAALNDLQIDLELVRLWFEAQLLKLTGHQPNLSTDAQGKQLNQEALFNFDSDRMAFVPHEAGRYRANHIKFLRLCFSESSPAALTRIEEINQLVKETGLIIKNMTTNFINV